MIRRAVIFSFSGIFLISLLLQSCMNTKFAIQNTSWRTSSIDAQVDWVLPDEDDIENIKYLFKVYGKYPYNKNNTSLLFNKLLTEKSKSNKYYIFDIEYIDDVHIVFKLNKNNDLIDKFIISGWPGNTEELGK